MRPEIIQRDLPRKLRNRAATMTAEGIAAGESPDEARQKTAAAMKRIYPSVAGRHRGNEPALRPSGALRAAQIGDYQCHVITTTTRA